MRNAPVYRRSVVLPPQSRAARHAHTRAPLIAAARQEPLGFGLAVLAALWITTLFDPQWYLIALGAPLALGKIPVLLFAALLATLAIGVPTIADWRQRWQWCAPFLLYVLIGIVTIPFALNNGYAREATQMLLIWWALIVGTVALVGTVQRAEMLVMLYGVQFLWWALWGSRIGLIGWHHTLSNYDGFGALMVGGLGISYFLALASPTKGFRWLMYATTGLCALGVVASFARGAFLAAVLLFFVIWVRSPHKGKTALAGVAGAVVMVLAATLLFEDGFFWNEIMSAFHEGTEEGTGSDRWLLWSAAWRVFQERPLFGAGPRNWGVLASTLFEQGELAGEYANPGALYDRSLHSLYMTTLSELGIAGVIALAWLLIDFWRRNAALRTEAAQQRWRELGGRFELRPIALGLEAAMVAFLFDAAIYSMMVIHWFYTMLALNLLLHALAMRQAGPAAPARTVRRWRGQHAFAAASVQSHAGSHDSIAASNS